MIFETCPSGKENSNLSLTIYYILKTRRKKHSVTFISKCKDSRDKNEIYLGPGIWLHGTALAWQARGPEFESQYLEKEIYLVARHNRSTATINAGSNGHI